ncbi:MAG: hypothetical protein Q4C49_13640 [Bacillota bacterium]|nr:hypothetical protein [Bacillota bacterium]
MAIRKIKIMDDDNLREQLDTLYESLPQICIAKWALELAKHCMCMAGISELDFPEITDGFRVNEMWQNGKARMYDVRQAGFQIHKIARVQDDEITKVAFRVIGQAVGTAHMKEHGMVASDYAIKLINLKYPKDHSKVLEERNWQIGKLKELAE